MSSKVGPSHSCDFSSASAMWIYWMLIALGSVRTYSADTDPDIDTTELTPSINETTEPAEATTDETTTDDAASTTTLAPTTVPDATTTTVNGTPAPTSDDGAPYMAAIIHENGFLIGSGAIVGVRWILVTAFQMGAFKADQLRVRVGSESAVLGGQLLSVSHLYPHPMFRQFNNDVALLRTSLMIMFSSLVQPIPVAPSPPDMGDQAALVTWDEVGNLSKKQVDILPISECRAFYPDYELTESNICAVLDQILSYRVSLYGSPLVWNRSLVGLYMSVEPNVFKPVVCSSLAPLTNWVRLMMTNATDTLLLFPLS